jgi:DNA-binding FadR family transcriptional regulator
MRVAHGQVGHIVRAPKTSELIAAQLRRQIVRAAVKAGEKLPSETELMEQFGVSRPTIREAFRILETEQLIVVRPGSRGGAQVLAPDSSVATRYCGLLLQLQGATLADVYEARQIAEPACARLLALRRTEQDIADLAGVVAEIESAIDGWDRSVPDPAAWSRITHRFHQLILQRSGNQTLALQNAVLRDIVAAHTELRISRLFNETDFRADLRRCGKVYRKLVALVEARNSDGAERFWRGYMEAAAASLLKDDLQDMPVVELFT